MMDPGVTCPRIIPSIKVFSSNHPNISTNSWYMIGIAASPPPNEKRSIRSITVASKKYFLFMMKRMPAQATTRSISLRKYGRVLVLTNSAGDLHSFLVNAIPNRLAISNTNAGYNLIKNNAAAMSAIIQSFIFLKLFFPKI